MSTYRLLKTTSQGVIFADLANSSTTLSFAQSRSSVASVNNKTKSVPILRNEVVLTTPTTVMPFGCTDVCDALNATRSVRISISAPLSQKVNAIADLMEIRRVIDLAITDGFLEGFLPNLTSSFPTT